MASLLVAPNAMRTPAGRSELLLTDPKMAERTSNPMVAGSNSSKGPSLRFGSNARVRKHRVRLRNAHRARYERDCSILAGQLKQPSVVPR